jgi:hypothetical protein
LAPRVGRAVTASTLTPQKFMIRRWRAHLHWFLAGLILLADLAIPQIVSIALKRRSASPLSWRERIVR